jgi:hypothetical protein
MQPPWPWTSCKLAEAQNCAPRQPASPNFPPGSFVFKNIPALFGEKENSFRLAADGQDLTVDRTGLPAKRFP